MGTTRPVRIATTRVTAFKMSDMSDRIKAARVAECLGTFSLLSWVYCGEEVLDHLCFVVNAQRARFYDGVVASCTVKHLSFSRIQSHFQRLRPGFFCGLFCRVNHVNPRRSGKLA